MSAFEYDLAVLVPDDDIAAVINSLLLKRTISLGIREISFKIDVHSLRDHGCCMKWYGSLKYRIDECKYALIVFDRHGCGKDSLSVEEIEKFVINGLSNYGWEKKVEIVVIDPEVEIWVWSGSRHVKKYLGWDSEEDEYRSWLKSEGLWSEGNIKPEYPKEAMLKALRKVNQRPSASIFGDLARNVSLQNCTDPAFIKLKTTLQNWFPR